MKVIHGKLGKTPKPLAPTCEVEPVAFDRLFSFGIRMPHQAAAVDFAGGGEDPAAFVPCGRAQTRRKLGVRHGGAILDTMRCSPLYPLST